MIGKRICIVADSEVDRLYGTQVQQLLVNGGWENVCRFSFPAGEENKTLDVITDLYEFLILHQFDRSDVLVALGGGVTGDMTGYQVDVDIETEDSWYKYDVEAVITDADGMNVPTKEDAIAGNW